MATTMGSRLSRHRSLEGGSRQRHQASGCGKAEGHQHHFPLALLLRGSQKLPGTLWSTAKAAPYERQVQWIRQIQATLRTCHWEQVFHILPLF